MLEGWSKLQGDWLHGTPLLDSLDDWVEADKTYGFFLPVVQTARAHPKIFGALVTVGELSIGLSMLLGAADAPRRVPGRADAVLVRLRRGQGLVPPGNALLMGAIFMLFVGRAAGPRARPRRGACAAASPAGWSSARRRGPGAAYTEGVNLSPGWIFASLIVSSIGFILLNYGRKFARVPQVVVGVLMLVYPYFVPGVLANVLVAVGLLAVLGVVVRLGW